MLRHGVFRLKPEATNLPASGFRLPASSIRLPASSFRLPTFSFRLRAERGTLNLNPRTPNLNPEPGTRNPEPEPQIPNLNPEPEPRTRNRNPEPDTILLHALVRCRDRRPRQHPRAERGAHEAGEHHSVRVRRHGGVAASRAAWCFRRRPTRSAQCAACAARKCPIVTRGSGPA